MDRLRRSKDSVLGGVCAGIAEHIGWEASKVRLIYLILSIFSAGFPGIFLYIILWIFMPAPLYR